MLIHLTFRFYLVGMLDRNLDVRDSGDSNHNGLHYLLMYLISLVMFSSVAVLYTRRARTD